MSILSLKLDVINVESIQELRHENKLLPTAGCPSLTIAQAKHIPLQQIVP
jgi:hypothetical protein